MRCTQSCARRRRAENMFEWAVSSSMLILIILALRVIFRGKISLRL